MANELVPISELPEGTTLASDDLLVYVDNSGTPTTKKITEVNAAFALGISGYSGYSGTGSSGYSGFSGAGSSGYSGFSGAGTSGYSGYSGEAGAASASGYSGYSGVSGYSGFSGVGTSGYSGYSGAGTSGYSGYSGGGTSGYSGFSGAGGGVTIGDTQVAYADGANTLAGDADLTWNKTSNTLTVAAAASIGAAGVGLGTNASAVNGIKMTRDGHIQWSNSAGAWDTTIDVEVRRINAGYGLITQNDTDADRTTPTNQRWIYTQGGHRVTADFGKNNDTLATITGCTVPLLTGSSDTFNYYTFVFEAEANCDATGGYKFAVAYSGTLDEGITYFIHVIDEADGSTDTYSRQTSSGGSAGAAGPTAIHVRIVGNVCPGSNGNLTIQFAQNTANGTSTVLELGSLLTVTPILD